MRFVKEGAMEGEKESALSTGKSSGASVRAVSAPLYQLSVAAGGAW